MRVYLGRGATRKVDNKRLLDISYHDINRWFSRVYMGLWEKGNHQSLFSNSKLYFNWGRLLPRSIAEKIVVRSLNKQSQKVAKINLVERR